ncbi:MAG: hypothetical protein U9R02_16670 [Thermodesulfobacteriota bacterium]|nr:hypothetical protein [Thermodesulfobacteriota bacterium]
MTDHPDFYTKTMARLYADQGYLTKAAEIYRFLLKQEPERQELPDRQSLIDELFEIEKKLSEKVPGDPVLLFSKWIDLGLKYNNLKKLKNIKNRL